MIAKGEAEEFWRRIQPKDYSIIMHLENTHTQISILALLMSSQCHKQVLLKDLDEAYVPTGTRGENLFSMIRKVVGSHHIYFKKELPFEGIMHNKTLHVSLKCCDQVVN